MTHQAHELGLDLLRTEVEQQTLLLLDQKLKLAAVEFVKNPSPKNQVSLIEAAGNYGDQYFSIVDNQLNMGEE